MAETAGSGGRPSRGTKRNYGDMVNGYDRAAAGAAAAAAAAAAIPAAALHAPTPSVSYTALLTVTPPGSGASAGSSASGSSSSAPAGASATSTASGAVSAGSSGLVLLTLKRPPTYWGFLSAQHTPVLWASYDAKTQNDWASKLKNMRANKPNIYHDPMQEGVHCTTDFQGAPVQHQAHKWVTLTPDEKREWMIDNGVNTKIPKDLNSFHGIKVLHHDHGTTTGTMQAVAAPPTPTPSCDNCLAPATDPGTGAEPMPPPLASRHCPSCGPAAGVNLCDQCCEAIHSHRINLGHDHFEVVDWAGVGKRNKNRGVRKRIPPSGLMRAAADQLQPGMRRNTMWEMMKQAASAVAYSNVLAKDIAGPRNTFGLLAATSNSDDVGRAQIQCAFNDCPSLQRITLMGEPCDIGSLLSRTSVCTKVKVGIPRDIQSSNPDAVKAIEKFAADDQNFRFADNADSFYKRVTFEESGDDRPVSAAASARGSIQQAVTAVSPSAEGLQPHLVGVAASDAGQSETNGSSVTTNPNAGSDSQVLTDEDEPDGSQDSSQALPAVQEAEDSSSAGSM